MELLESSADVGALKKRRANGGTRFALSRSLNGFRRWMVWSAGERPHQQETFHEGIDGNGCRSRPAGGNDSCKRAERSRSYRQEHAAIDDGCRRCVGRAESDEA